MIRPGTIRTLARPSAWLALGIGACAALSAGAQAIGLNAIVLSADGRLSIAPIHAALGVATLGLAMLGPIVSAHRSARDRHIDRKREQRFNSECHLVGVATVVLLIASLHLAAPPKAPATVTVTEALPD